MKGGCITIGLSQCHRGSLLRNIVEYEITMSLGQHEQNVSKLDNCLVCNLFKTN